MGYEIRSAPLTAEWRVKENDDGSVTLVGHAAVFNQLSDEIGGFREMIAPGAFARSIAEEADVRALWNHDANYILGRTKAGTLRVIEDDIGLAVEIDAPRTTTITDLVVEPIRRGDVDQMSFAFVVRQDTWTKGKNQMPDTRVLLDLDLCDVSPVTFPAYPQTDVAVRAQQHERFRREIEDFERAKRQRLADVERKCREFELYL